MLLFLTVGILLSTSAFAGEYSIACKKVYRSDVVRGTAYQTFCLAPRKPKVLKPTPLRCITQSFSPMAFKREFPQIKKLIGKSDYAEVAVPEGLRMLVAYYLKDLKNVRIIPSRSGEAITVKLCEGGKKND
jgi:hypothetical protein